MEYLVHHLVSQSLRRRFTKSLTMEPLQLNRNHEANVQGQLMIRDSMAQKAIGRSRPERLQSVVVSLL